MFRGVIIGVVAMAPAVVYRVHAEGESTKVKVKDLPIYREPEPAQLIYTPEKITPYREQISVVRQTVSDYYGSVQSITDKVKVKLEVAKAHTMDVFHYFREDAGAVPKATFVTLAGLGGLVIGYKGKPGAPFRTALLTTTLVAGASYVCYPEPMSKAVGEGWDRIKAQYHEMKSASSKSAPPVSPSSPQSTVASSKDVVTTETHASEVRVSEADKDHGMSKAEDKDLYTTRGS